MRLGNQICERHFLASSEKTHTRKFLLFIVVKENL